MGYDELWLCRLVKGPKEQLETSISKGIAKHRGNRPGLSHVLLDHRAVLEMIE